MGTETGSSAQPSKTTDQPSSTTSAAGAPKAPNESLVCQDPGETKFKKSDAEKHLDEYCTYFDGKLYPPITNRPSSLKKYYDRGSGIWVELWSTINTQDDKCKAGEVKFSKADCYTALRNAFNKCHDPNSDDATGGNAEPFYCADFGACDNIPTHTER